MAEKQGEQEMSEFAQALASRQRKTYEFDLSGFFGLAGTPLPMVAMRRPMAAEQDRALKGAHAYVDEVAGKIDALKVDPDLLQNAKKAFIAYEFSRDPKRNNYPLLPGPKWALEHLSYDEIGILVDLANEVRAKESSQRADVTDEAVEAYIRIAVEAKDAEIPGAVLVGVPREYLTHLIVMLALKVSEVRQQLAELAGARDTRPE
jgi:hypothetical protein